MYEITFPSFLIVLSYLPNFGLVMGKRAMTNKTRNMNNQSS